MDRDFYANGAFYKYYTLCPDLTVRWCSGNNLPVSTSFVSILYLSQFLCWFKFLVYYGTVRIHSSNGRSCQLIPFRRSSYKLESRIPSPSRKVSSLAVLFSVQIFFPHCRIITNVVGTVTTIFGIQLIDRVGRRRLLLIGAAGMCICEFIIAIVGVTAGHPTVTPSGIEVNLAAQRILIAFTCMLVVHLSLSYQLSNFSLHSYIALFSTSWGPVIWVLTGELFVSFFFPSIIPFFVEDSFLAAWYSCQKHVVCCC